MSGRCPDCDCPNRFCACVLLERVRCAERREREAAAIGAEHRELFAAAASCLAYNRGSLSKPRGPDERRLLAFIGASGAPLHGHFWSGRTDGWLNWLEPRTVERQPEQTSLLDGAA